MAALVEGVQYALSSHSNIHENKSLVFVKLTDSAHRAIEELLKNRQKNCKNPTVQFLGNEGRLVFPSLESSHGQKTFTFSLSSNADIEGPQGSFECIHQTSSKNGVVVLKSALRHVTESVVYEHVVCNLGTPNIVHGNIMSRGLEMLGALHCKMRIQAKEDVYEATRNRVVIAEENHKKNCTREIKPGGPGIGLHVKLKPSLKRVSSLPPSKRDRKPPPPSIPPKPPIHQVTNGHYGGWMSNGNGSVPHPPQPQPQQPRHHPNNHARQPGNPDLLKRPLRERLIHLLALRPFKKPELMDRITKDGCREKDRSNIMNVVKTVSFMRDNTYHLQRHVWNDVQGDWPFYTDEERQLMKRRKPQNLTPPGSSDGGSSTSSGHSPTSTLPGSPPSSVSSTVPTLPSPITGNVKRPGYVDGADGLPTKRQRISRFRKPPEVSSGGGGATYRTPDSSHGVLRDVTSAVPNGALDRRWREGNSHSASHTNNNNNSVARWGESESQNVTNKVAGTRSDSDVVSMCVVNRSESPSIVTSSSQSNQVNGRCCISASPASPDSQMDPVPDSNQDSSEYADYLTTYTMITDNEQRIRYKADFNADYSEYRELHAVVERVSRRFAQLEEELNQQEKDSPGYRNIKAQIMREYREKKQDRAHQEATRRFKYLHEKLSHIKRLVLEYDTHPY